MAKCEIDYAVKKALDNLDDWIETTGVLLKGGSYYYELQSIIESSVRIGAKIAIEGINADLSDILD